MSPTNIRLEGLVPALFIVGTEDGLLDDTILMSGKWAIAGNETVVKFFPGAAHGFMNFGADGPVTRLGWDTMIAFLDEKLKAGK